MNLLRNWLGLRVAHLGLWIMTDSGAWKLYRVQQGYWASRRGLAVLRGVIKEQNQ